MSQVNPIPEGMHSVTPHLVCSDAAKAIEFYRQAFNATEMIRVTRSWWKIDSCLCPNWRFARDAGRRKSTMGLS